MSIDWNFPSNNFGTVSGIGEAGIETFKGSPYRSLAREICQNSLDARLDPGKPVKVDFSLSYISSGDIKQFDSLRDAFKSCRSFWREQGNKKTVDFFTRALKRSESDKIPMLRISDFNTTGLTGSDKEYNSPWQNLVKASGVSSKGGSSGGSFGIGKSAPFACSDFRTVFYSTLDSRGQKAFQGVARQVSFRQKNIFGLDSDSMTTGMGFYGDTRKNAAIPECISLDRKFRRRTSGTDVFIAAFSEGKNWRDDIIRAVLSEFLISIFQDDLVVSVGDCEISSKTLPALVEQYREVIPEVFNYYQAMTSDKAVVISERFQDLGTIELHLLIQKDLHRKILMSRSSGMKIFDQNRISGTIFFAGVCILKDEKINAYFREMENPQHDAWEPERHSNPSAAKKNKQALYKRLKDIVQQYGMQTTLEEVDAEGMGEFLPDDEGISDGGEKTETISSATKDFDVAMSDIQTGQKGSENYADSDGAPADCGMGIAEGESSGGTGSNDMYDDENSSRSGGGFGGGDGDSEGADGEGTGIIQIGVEDPGSDSAVRKKTEMRVMRVRLFMTDPKQHRYRLIFTPSKSAQWGYLQFQLSGEQSAVDVKVRDSFLAGSGKKLSCHNNEIILGSFSAGQRLSVDFTIDYAEQSSMEVKLYGYQI